MASENEHYERVRHAEHLVGLSVTAVRYFDIDYRRWDLAPELVGPRVITDEAEWIAPTWLFTDCDSVDHGVELDASGRVFSITWDPPGKVEGIGIREEPLMGSALLPGSNVAIWDVGERSRWRDYIGTPVSGIKLRYIRWDETGAQAVT